MLDPRSRPLLVGALLLLVLAACQDAPTRPRTPSLAPSAEILDGGHGAGGNPHFYFLQPLVTPPATFAGTFDATQSPTVEICEWDATGCVGNDVASFSMTSGSGAAVIRVDATAQQYVVHWRTSRTTLDTTKIYRIRVLAGNFELGHADVQPVGTHRELRNIDTQEYVGLVGGSMLRIAFRIEQGGVPTVPLSVGSFHTCALSHTGAAYCWGQNVAGELGNGSTPLGGTGSEYYPIPQAVVGGLTFTALTTGFGFTCGLTTAGAAYCWGGNSDGALGTGTAGGVRATPQLVTGGHVYTAIAAGHAHACGLAVDHTAYCWGSNFAGQLGTGGTTSSAAPTAVAGYAFFSLAAGQYFTCGVTTAGAAYCWGNDSFGQLGNGVSSPNAYYARPQLVSGAIAFVSLSLGNNYTCGITTAGVAYCWGVNVLGELGNGLATFFGTGSTVYASPQLVSGGLTFEAIRTGTAHTCGLTASGTAYCWGSNVEGELGTGSASPSLIAVPTPVPNLAFTSIGPGNESTCGILTDGTARCWGGNTVGELGTGTVGSSFTAPQVVTGGITFFTP